MDKFDELEELMNKRGYTTISMRSGNRSSMTLIPKDTDNILFSVTIYVDSEEFMLQYTVPQSINTLSTPKCGSVRNEEHFNRIVDKFKSQVEILHNEFDVAGKCGSCKFYNCSTKQCKNTNSLYSNMIMKPVSNACKHYRTY